MTEPWIIEECRRQAVLYLAAAMGAADRATGAACPRPLVPRAGALAGAIDAAWKELLGRRGDPAKAADRVAGMLQGSDPAWFPAEPWTFGELIGWWLGAGESLIGHEEVWRADIEHALGECEGGQPAALWCAACWSHYALSAAAFTSRREDAAWQERPDQPTPYLRRLFDWVASRDRQRPDRPDPKQQPWPWIDAMREEAKSLAQDAQRLFGPGSPWRSGEPLTPRSAADWFVLQWCDRLPGNESWAEVRRPVVGAAANSPPLALGWAVSRRPGGVLKNLLVHRDGCIEPADSLTTALRFAADRWAVDFRPSQAWPRAAAREALAALDNEAAVLAVGRLLTALHSCHTPDVEGPTNGSGEQAIRTTLALDGFVVFEANEADPADKSDPQWDRLILSLGQSAAGGRRRLLFHIRPAGLIAPVGWTDGQAIPTTRLTRAIEEVDWRVWHCRVVATTGPQRPNQRVALMVCQQVKLGRWEEMKRVLVTAGKDAAGERLLAEAFGFAHRRRLRLELLHRKISRAPAAVAAVSELSDAFRELAAGILECLGQLDAAAPSRLVPPRKKDGSVDGVAWLAHDGQAPERDKACLVSWQRSDRPVGIAISEQQDEHGLVRVALSAGDASEADVRLLEVALGPATLKSAATPQKTADAWSGLAQRLAARLKARLAAGHERVDFGAEVAWLRECCEHADADAFAALVSGRLAGVESATAWCRLLTDDPRFKFVVHPPVDLETRSVPAAAPDDEGLLWSFHPTIPAGRDVSVEYAIVPRRARRVISRGPRGNISPADRADALALAAGSAGGVFAEAATAVQAATDRWLTFPGRADHPTRAAGPLLRHVVREDTVPGPERAAVFAALQAWALSVGYEVVPTSWSPGGFLGPEALPAVLSPPEYHGAVPAGRLIIESLGVMGEEPLPVEAALSAGPPPSGYPELRATLESLVDAPQGPAGPWQEAARRVRELPRHSLAGSVTLAGPNLFDCIWEAAASVADRDDRRIDAAKEQMLTFLKAACEMVSFHPKSPGDFASGWVQEAGGLLPRGRRIKTVERPGLRTLANKLVRPAVVVTE